MLSYLFIFVYLVFLLLVGNLSNLKKTDKNYTLAGRKMRTFPVLISILATETSAASLLLFPDLGFNPKFRFIFLQMVAGMALGRLLSAYLLIGPIYNSNKESVYEVLSERLSAGIADLCALLYAIATVLAAGVRLFIGSIALSILLSRDENLNYFQISFFILLAGSIAVYYSRKGGLKAVIYTDNLQFFMIIAALAAILVMNLKFLDLSSVKYTDFLRLTPPPDKSWLEFTYSFPLAFIGGIILSFGSHGIDQTTIQRVLAQRSVKEARQSMIYSAALIFPFIFLFLLCGFLIFQVNEKSNVFNKVQYIYPWFLHFKNISWLAALTAVSFLSAAMSSIDSALHSLATSLKQTDFKFFRNSRLTQLTLYSGMALLVSALFFQFVKWINPDATLISLALGATGMIFSPLSGLYLMIFHYPSGYGISGNKKEHSKIASISLFSGIICNLIFFSLNNFFNGPGISWLFSLVCSFFITIIIYILGSYYYRLRLIEVLD